MKNPDPILQDKKVYSQVNHPVYKLFKKLLVPSPSGREEAVAKVVKKELEYSGYSFETDPAGNILVRIPGKLQGPVCCFAAHMDEIGMVVTKVESDGTLHMNRSGGLYPWKLGEGPVEILGDFENIIGILSMGSTHTTQAESTQVTWQSIRVMTGFHAEHLEKIGVRPGSLAVPMRERRGPVLFGDPADPFIAAWTFDDRIGVVTLLRLLKLMAEENIQPHFPLIVAFTVQEERGGNGAKLLAHREKPTCFIAVDGAPMPPGSGLSLDGRPAIWSKDRLVSYDHKLLLALSQSAVEVGTSLQSVVYDSAASDASLVSYSGGAPRAACVGHVRENSHGYEVARFSVFDHLLKTLAQFVRTWKGE